MSALLLAVLWASGAWPAFSQTSPTYAWTTFVGQAGASGTNDGTGTGAQKLNSNQTHQNLQNI
jgi:hypothetical protein